MRMVLLAAALGALSVPVALFMLARYAARRAALRAAGLRLVGELVWDPRAHYSPDHLWLRREEDGVHLGADDLARRLLRPETAIELPAVGRELDAGDVLVTLSCPGHRVTLRTPVAGTVLATTPAGAGSSRLVRRQPYGKGWLVTLAAAELPGEGLVHGEAARDWLARERLRLLDLLSQQLEDTGAGQAELLEEGAGLLSTAHWAALCRAFLGGV